MILRSQKDSTILEVSTSQFFGNPSRPTICAYSDLNGTSRSVTKAVVTNGVSRPTPPPYEGGAMWS